MITKIGIVAGEIWQLLDSVENIRVRDIKSKLDRPEDLILMSLGWLSREGHIVLDREGNDFIVTLREAEQAKT